MENLADSLIWNQWLDARFVIVQVRFQATRAGVEPDFAHTVRLTSFSAVQKMENLPSVPTAVQLNDVAPNM